MSRDLARVLLIALALRIGLVLNMHHQVDYALTPDSYGYERLATNLYHYGMFSLSEDPHRLVPETGRTPGYPAFLAIFYDASGVLMPWAVLFMQALLGTATCGFAYQISMLLWGRQKAALFAGMALAIDPVSILHGGVILTETLYVFCFVLAFLILANAILKYSGMAQTPPKVKSKPQKCTTAHLDIKNAPAQSASVARGRVYICWAFSGLLFGLAALMRPIGLCYAIFVTWILFLFTPKSFVRSWFFLGAFVLAAALPPGLWTVRNMVTTRVNTFSAEQKLKPDAVVTQLRSPMTYGSKMANNLAKMLGGHGMELAAWMVLHDKFYDPVNPPTWRDLNHSGHFAGTNELIERHRGMIIAISLYLLALFAVYIAASIAFFHPHQLYSWIDSPLTLLVASPIIYHVALNVAITTCYYRQRVPVMPFILILAGRGLFP